MDSPFLGLVQIFAFNYSPLGWVPCYGQTLQVNQYSALFSLIGTTFGGNGTSTFQLPNLRGAVPSQKSNFMGYHICLSGAYPQRQ